jgi:molybdopterin synthase catalytic subunit
MSEQKSSTTERLEWNFVPTHQTKEGLVLGEVKEGVLGLFVCSAEQGRGRIISAAPDMLDALKTAAFIFKKEYGYKPEAEPTVGSRWYESVVNAIAKAEGKQ